MTRTEARSLWRRKVIYVQSACTSSEHAPAGSMFACVTSIGHFLACIGFLLSSDYQWRYKGG
uniref:Uncharacterized protein n=1 Tax=Anguilla anguilla TaxID=7936 RepID=A0A0E9WNN2_ANGAN